MVSDETLQNLLQAAEGLVQTAKMMRAVGTGGMAGTHPKMLAMTQAIAAAKAELTPPPAPPQTWGRGSDKNALNIEGGVEDTSFVPYGETTFAEPLPAASKSKAKSK